MHHKLLQTNSLVVAKEPHPIKIEEKHFPIFLRGKNLNLQEAALILRTPRESTIGAFEISINGSELTGDDFSVDNENDDEDNERKIPKWGGLPYAPIAQETGIMKTGITGTYEITIKDGGDLAPAASSPSDPSAIDAEKLSDFYLSCKIWSNFNIGPLSKKKNHKGGRTKTSCLWWNLGRKIPLNFQKFPEHPAEFRRQEKLVKFTDFSPLSASGSRW